MSRRDSLRLSALAAAGSSILRQPAMRFAHKTELLYGVQIFTVRHEAAQDLPKLLRTLRQIGFTQVVPTGTQVQLNFYAGAAATGPVVQFFTVTQNTTSSTN